jgi:hypothetical protein
MSRHKPLIYSRNARTRGAYIALGASIAVWFALGAIHAHWILLALFVIPPSLVAWDIMKNDTAHLELTDSHLNYGIGTDLDRVPLNRIEVIRLNRRLDFSWRVTMRLTDGSKLRIPPPCVPMMAQFEAALEARDVRIDRILFAFAG